MTDNTQRAFLPGRNKLVLNRTTVMRALEEYLNSRITFAPQFEAARGNDIAVVDLDSQDAYGCYVAFDTLIATIEPAETK